MLPLYSQSPRDAHRSSAGNLYTGGQEKVYKVSTVQFGKSPTDCQAVQHVLISWMLLRKKKAKKKSEGLGVTFMIWLLTWLLEML